MARNEQIHRLIEPTVTGLGYQLWGVELLSQGRHSTLRIYIEHKDGITVDDCARVSHQVSGVLDVEDPIQSRYTLEVSSPGIDRPLFALEQYPAYVGQWLKVRLRTPFEGRRKFSGVLTAVEGDEVVVRIDDEEYMLPFEMIEKATVVCKD